MIGAISEGKTDGGTRDQNMLSIPSLCVVQRKAPHGGCTFWAKCLWSAELYKCGLIG